MPGWTQKCKSVGEEKKHKTPSCTHTAQWGSHCQPPAVIWCRAGSWNENPSSNPGASVASESWPYYQVLCFSCVSSGNNFSVFTRLMRTEAHHVTLCFAYYRNSTNVLLDSLYHPPLSRIGCVRSLTKLKILEIQQSCLVFTAISTDHHTDHEVNQTINTVCLLIIAQRKSSVVHNLLRDKTIYS